MSIQSTYRFNFSLVISMAIAFARLQFVQRSAGKNACAKAAYNSRSLIAFQGTEFQQAKTYNWSHKEPTTYHSILLPKGADEKFKDMQILWNAVEQKENRKNSQTALEIVLALPDDLIISLEDKKILTESFISKYFIDKGLIAQIDIHSPDKKIILSPEVGELDELNHNWHAHVLITTRRIQENGQEFEDHKARDLMPSIRNGKVIDGERWGKLWADHQNHYFEEKGLDLRVDPTGIVAQKHLGPVRMRNIHFSYLDEHQENIALNQLESTNVKNILNKITNTKSIFTAEDVERFLLKHVASERIEQVREAFWKQEHVIQLLDPKTEQVLNKFTTQEIIEEEQQLMRLAEALYAKDALKIDSYTIMQFANNLNTEQQIAFKNILRGRALNCIEGYAGTGKSHLLATLKTSYESNGYLVRAFGPDHATVKILKDKGFSNTETLHRFLFLLHHDKKEIRRGKEIWIVDEAGKLGNRPLLEFLKAAKSHDVQLIFAGDSAQMTSVDRGGVFQAFSQKFGAEFLRDIQRQQNIQERAAAKSLAVGEMGHAIDLLTKNGNIRWTVNKDEAKEALIKKWALDQIAFPNHRALIIAHSNKEVRDLNQLARLYRKQKGELGEKEYLCQSLHGKILVSTGDKLEFRGNDKNLGITNGMVGTLIEASSQQFVVLLNEGKISRKVSFHPEQYSSFQLAYASTNFRSQGGTFDRVYVLHSKAMDKPGYYVSMTRHAKKAYLYVSKTEASCLSHLKRQAYRQNPRETTLNFITREQLSKHKESVQREQYLKDLKDSSSLLSKIKGHTLSTWDHLHSKINQSMQNFSDLKENESFFNVQLLTQNIVKSPAIEFQVNEWLGKTSDLKPELIKLVQTAAKQENFSTINFEEEYSSSKQDKWQTLSDKNQQILKAYYQSKNEASQWYAMMQSNGSHQEEWKSACIERNALAHQVMQNIPKEQISKILTKTSLDILQDQSTKHVIALSKKENTLTNIETKLKEHMEQLAYKLLPEGPTRKNSRELRFGTNGSLCITCRGKQAGSFYDFESNKGGGPLQLIQYKLNCDLKEAKDWALHFLGEANDLFLPAKFYFKETYQEKQNELISLKPNSNIEVPTFEKIAPQLSQIYNETARYAYKDSEGHLLFYVLRLAQKDDASKKIFLHLSYGCYKGQNPNWILKSYQANKKPLYQLEQITQHPQAKILIVEGEKAAEATPKMFPKETIVCLTWCGGATAVSKTDWTPLYHKDVIIWPDNDEAGFKAADHICSELRKVGVNSLSVVDKNILKKELPPKWDLADPLPENKPQHFIKTLISTANNKAVGLDELKRELKISCKIAENNLLLATLQAKEVLWRLEERMYPELEKKWGGKIREIHDEILKETLKIFQSKTSIEKDLQGNLGLTGDIKEKIAYQAVLYQASTGKLPSLNQFEEMKQMMMSIKVNPYTTKKYNKEWERYIENSLWSVIFESKMYVNEKDVSQFFQKGFLEKNHQVNQMIVQEQKMQIMRQQKRHKLELSL